MVWLVVQVALIVLFAASTFALVFGLQFFAKRFIDEENHAKPRRRQVTRGNEIGTLAEAQAQVDRLASPAEEDPRTLYVGGLWSPRSEETSHCFVAGTTGSGKSLTSYVHMSSALRRIISPIGGEPRRGGCLRQFTEPGSLPRVDRRNGPHHHLEPVRRALLRP